MTFNAMGDVWDEERTTADSAWRRADVAERLGGEMLGATLYLLDPGGTAWPYHYHHANEELAIVLEGGPTLRTPEWSRRLGPGDIALFPRGPEGAHAIHNESNAPARLLMVSTTAHPEVACYPDSGQLAVFAGAAPKPGQRAPVELVVDETR